MPSAGSWRPWGPRTTSRIERYRATLSGALATIEAHLGRLFVDADAPGGQVLVNGTTAQALPSTEPIRVVAGTVDLVVRAPGYVEAHRRIEVAPGGEAHETFRLEPVPAAAIEPPPPVETPTEVDAAPRPRSATAGYAALGIAGALAIGGIVAWKVRQDDAAVWNDDSRCLVPGQGTRGQQCGSYASGANAGLALEIGAFAAAATSGGIGAWLLWPVRRDGKAAAWCAPSGAAGLTCGGRF